MVEISLSMNYAWKSDLFHEQLNSNSFAHRYATGSILRIYFAQFIRDGCVLAPCKTGFFVSLWVGGSLGHGFVLSSTTKARQKGHQMATWQRHARLSMSTTSTKHKNKQKKRRQGDIEWTSKQACMHFMGVDRQTDLHACVWICVWKMWCVCTEALTQTCPVLALR